MGPFRVDVRKRLTLPTTGADVNRRLTLQTTTQNAITLEVNGEATTLNAGSLADLIAHLDLGDAKCATAVNGDFVAAGARQAVRLNDGDKVEIVTARQGG